MAQQNKYDNSNLIFDESHSNSGVVSLEEEE